MLLIPLAINLYHDNKSMDNEQSLCPFKMATGFPCPGCGITKSFISVYQKEWKQAFKYHMFGPFFFLFLIFFILVTLLELFYIKSFPVSSFFPKNTGLFLAILLMIYQTIRLAYFVHQYSFQQIIHQSIWK